MGKSVKFLRFLAILCVALLLGGCGDTSAVQNDEKVQLIYYTTAERVSLTTETRPAVEEGTLGQKAYVLLEEMLEPSKIGNRSLFTVSGLINRINIEGNILNIYMTEAYSTLSVPNEILLRAGIVLTLTQLEGVDYVSFYVNEQPLTDAMGNAVGVMSGNSFLDSRGENLSNYQQVTLVVYFGDAEGKLVETERESTISSSFSKERQVVEALLDGPEDSGLLATMPAGTGIVNISVKNNICYVNFDSDFLTGDLTVSPYVTIYSLVNSLTELPNINKVQIMVDGDSSDTFRSVIPLDAPFERNLDYVVTGGK